MKRNIYTNVYAKKGGDIIHSIGKNNNFNLSNEKFFFNEGYLL